MFKGRNTDRKKRRDSKPFMHGSSRCPELVNIVRGRYRSTWHHVYCGSELSAADLLLLCRPLRRHISLESTSWFTSSACCTSASFASNPISNIFIITTFAHPWFLRCSIPLQARNSPVQRILTSTTTDWLHGHLSGCSFSIYYAQRSFCFSLCGGYMWEIKLFQNYFSLRRRLYKKFAWNYFKIISEAYCSPWIFANMFNVAEIILK